MAKERRQRTTAKSRPSNDDKFLACSMPEIPERILPPTLHPGRLGLIRLIDRKWVNGTVLHYYFFDQPSDGTNGAWVGAEAQKNVVRSAFQEWKELGIGLEFVEVAAREDAEVRIGFEQNGRSWSYVGRDVIDVARDPNERTMNLGWDLTTDYGHDTARHEIGHTLGFPHEHQNPNAGIEWDEDAVYRYFRGYPNYWPDDTIYWNILRKLPTDEVSGSAWDPNSIMHYAFPSGVIKEPAEYVGGLTPAPGLSEKDIEFARRFYPTLESQEEPELRAFESQRILIAAGGQINFRIRPRFTRTYAIQTFGESDTVIVLFEDQSDDVTFVAGDDDSGTDRNARIDTRLYKDHEYTLRVRLYFSHLTGESAVMLW